MLQLGAKMSLGRNVTVDQMFSGRSVRFEMSLGRSVGGRSVGGHSVGGHSVGGRSVGGRSIGGRSVKVPAQTLIYTLILNMTLTDTDPETDTDMHADRDMDMNIDNFNRKHTKKRVKSINPLVTIRHVPGKIQEFVLVISSCQWTRVG
jgi:hypothetical protein